MRREAFEENLDLQPQTERIGNQNKTMRKAKPKKHVILPDPVYGDVKVTKFVNNLMYSGKKSIAYSIFYNALSIVEKKMKDADKPSLEIWKKALDNITPQVEVKSRRIGGATFQVPTEIRPDRKEAISMKNMISFARKRSGKNMAEKLSSEIMDAYNEQGGAFKRKEDMHRMAEAILVSWPTLMRVRQLLLSASFSTLD